MRYKVLLILCVFSLFINCKKEKKSIQTEKIELPTSYSINDILFVGNKIYIAGGDLWQGGFVLKSNDNGQTWEQILDHWNLILSIDVRENNRIVACSYFGGLYISNDDGQNWTYREDLSSKAINDIVILNDSTFFCALGESRHFGGYGRYHFSSDSLAIVNLLQEVKKTHFFNESVGVCAAYGVIYYTQDGGLNLEPTNGQGDFFRDLSFNSNRYGVAVGYEGLILYTNDGRFWRKYKKLNKTATAKKNLEGIALINKGFVTVGQNGTILYTPSMEDKLVVLEHDFGNVDFKSVKVKDNIIYVGGSNGLFFRFQL